MGREQIAQAKDDSVRVTLRISKECAEAIEWLALRNRSTQKQLFDRVSKFLLSFTKPDGKDHLSAVMVDTFKKSKRVDTIRKAQVVSRHAHRVLKSFSERHGVSRDVVVEGAIDFIKAVEKLYADKNKEAHREAKKIIDDLWGQAEASERKIKDIAGEEDAVLHRFGVVIVILMNLSADIESELEEGIPVDPEGM